MSIQYYFFAVAFYLLGGFCLFLCMRRVWPHLMNKERTKMIFLAGCSALTLGGVGLATFAFLYF